MRHSRLRYWSLVLDVLGAKVLVWIASRGSANIELTPDAHLFFADRYQQLADTCAQRGPRPKAQRLASLADDHLKASGHDGPPFAAAMAMPRPRRFIVTDAVSRVTLRPPDDVA